MRCEKWIEADLTERRAEGLERRLHELPGGGGHVKIDGRTFLNCASNDYLNLAHDPEVVAVSRRMLDEGGCGAGASRLVTGTHPWHSALESRLAAFKGYPSALVFGSGYLTNCGVISAVVGRGDLVFVDRLSHASILDAVALSRATLHRFHHNNAQHLATLLEKSAGHQGRKLIVSESVFSMDGDLAPLQSLIELAEKHDALLMIDEAHSTGIFGPGGSGCIRAAGLEKRITLSMGTLSKAMGGYGGFIACSGQMRNWIINYARAFIYTTAIPPAVAGSALGALDVLGRRPDLGQRLLDMAEWFRGRLQSAGFDTGQSASQIIPVMIGDNHKAVALAKRLYEEGIIVLAVRPPTVPEGTARLRISLTLAHPRSDLEKAAEILVGCARQEGVL